jgi:plastocyanin
MVARRRPACRVRLATDAVERRPPFAEIEPGGSHRAASQPPGPVEDAMLARPIRDAMLARPIRTLALGVMTVLLTTACGGGDDLPTNVPTPNVTAEGAPASASAAGGSVPGDAAQVTIGTTTNAQLRFDPTSASVPTGGQVVLTFENLDTVPHNLTFDDPIEATTSTAVAPDASEVLEFQAPEPGSYPFVCTLHPGMEGVLEVTP